jgi:FAD/FMN-containing dehydrogenase
VNSNAPYKEEDTVVRAGSFLPQVQKIKEISEKYNITTISNGHAGDGNIIAIS